MGLLDDAIREHLDLKRRHGADPGEVARQEREAFGAGPMPPAPDLAAPAAVEPAAAVAEDTFEAPSRRSFDADVPGDDLPSASEALPALDAPAGAISADRFEDEIGWSDPPPLDPDPEPAAEAPQDEDVLEETPEFLQETPEHDRLWFEQRPPKDFDF